MAMTLAQLRTAVGDGLGDRSDVTSTLIDLYLNMSAERIARNKNWRELNQGPTDITLTYTGVKATDQTIDLSALTNLRDAVSWVVEDDGNSNQMRRSTAQQFDKVLPLPEYWASGRPHSFYNWTLTTALVWPAPDQEYTSRMLWTKWPTTMSADGDTSDLLQKDDMLVFLTVSFIYALLRETDEASRFFNFYRNSLKDSKESDDTLPDLRITPNIFGPDHLTLDRVRNPFYLPGD